MTRIHRAINTGDPEVLVQYAGFEAEEDEWVNFRKNVRQRCTKEATLKSLGDEVLVKINVVEDKIASDILLPTTTRSKPRGVEVVAVGEGTTIVLKWVKVDVKLYIRSMLGQRLSSMVQSISY
nr:20 kDa chaperonin, chloroplastic [Tanacetum cinerariifolium]